MRSEIMAEESPLKEIEVVMEISLPSSRPLSSCLVDQLPSAQDGLVFYLERFSSASNISSRMPHWVSIRTDIVFDGAAASYRAKGQLPPWALAPYRPVVMDVIAVRNRTNISYMLPSNFDDEDMPCMLPIPSDMPQLRRLMNQTMLSGAPLKPLNATWKARLPFGLGALLLASAGAATTTPTPAARRLLQQQQQQSSQLLGQAIPSYFSRETQQWLPLTPSNGTCVYNSTGSVFECTLTAEFLQRSNFDVLLALLAFGNSSLALNFESLAGMFDFITLHQSKVRHLR